MIVENLSEKLSTKFEVVSNTIIPEFEYFIKLKDFEKLLLLIMFISFLVVFGGLII